MTIPACITDIAGGSVDGHTAVVVAWQPNELDKLRISQGEPIFLSMLGGLAPHVIGTSFEDVTVLS